MLGRNKFQSAAEGSPVSPKAREEALKKLEELTGQDANCRRTTAKNAKQVN
jgi:hypothetical protein